MQQTFKITVTGQIQGVGFRPFIYGLAKEYQLSGTVHNDEKGVIIYINTSKETVDSFVTDIIKIISKNCFFSVSQNFQNTHLQ